MARPWDNENFAYRREFHIDPAHVGSDHAHFPFGVVADDDDEFPKAHIEEHCYIFYDHNGVRLNHDTEDFNEGVSYTRFIIWVGVTTVYASPEGDENKIWMYYDPVSIDGANDKTKVWTDAGYAAVWHMSGLDYEEAADDETGHGNNGASDAGTPTYAQAGKIQECVEFNGSTSYIVCANGSLDMAGTYTVEAWLYHDTTAGDVIFSVGNDTTHCYILLVSGGTAFLYNNTASSFKAVSFPTETWTRMVFEYDTVANTVTFIRDATNYGTSAQTTDPAPSSGAVHIGGLYSGASQVFDGKVDELRVAAKNFGEAWHIFSYYNQSEADFEIAWQGEEERGGEPPASYPMNADAGSFALAGQPAGLSVDLDLAAEAGAFGLTGRAAALRADRKSAAAVGAFTLTGKAAGLKADRRIAADPAAFALTGLDAGLLAARVLLAGTGAFALTGQDAALTYSGGGIVPAPYYRLLMGR